MVGRPASVGARQRASCIWQFLMQSRPALFAVAVDAGIAGAGVGATVGVAFGIWDEPGAEGAVLGFGATAAFGSCSLLPAAGGAVGACSSAFGDGVRAREASSVPGARSALVDVESSACGSARVSGSSLPSLQAVSAMSTRTQPPSE